MRPSKDVLILLSGKQGSGKTTLTKALRDYFTISGYYSYPIRFADPLYEMHDAIWKIMEKYGQKLAHKKDGPLLQLLGTEWGRNTIKETLWTDLCRRRVDDLLAIEDLYQPKAIIIDDARFETEFNAFPDALRVRLECAREIRQRRCEMWRENDTHPSEVGLDSYAAHGKFDVYLNTGVLNKTICLNTVIFHALEKFDPEALAKA